MSTRRVVPASPDHSLYPLMTAVVVPRPIAWVSTVSADGVGNLAPHSFFTVACANPAIVQFTSVGEKDTLRNVLATGEFVVSTVGRAHMEAANQTSAPYPADVDEAEAAGVRMEASETVRPLRVADSPVSLECRLHSHYALGDSTIVLGTVTAITIDEAALDGDHPTMAAIAPVSRLGRNEWGLPPEVVTLDRPTRA